MKLMEAQSVTHAYGTHPVLCNVSLQLGEGEFVVLIGPNGSGKSTLIKSVLGFLPASGDIRWNSKPVSQWRKRDLARVVSYLPQSPGYEPGQTTLEVLRQGRSSYWGAFGLESSGDEQVVHEVADLLALRDFLNIPVDQMSGGQRQRVLIGRCLCQQPKALLLDEPTTFLDLRHQLELCRTLRQLATDRKIAILMASHELNSAAAYSDRMVLLHQGKIVAEGKADEVLTPEILSPVYEVPIQRYGDAKNPVVAVGTA